MFVAILLALASPASGCRVVDEFETVMCPARLPARRWVTIDRAGLTAWREKVQPPDCRCFAPTPATVRRYLARAGQVDRGTVHYSLPESPCQATGRIGFADGRIGAFRVDQFAIMRLTVGREPEIWLYCPDCRFGGLQP